MNKNFKSGLIVLIVLIVAVIGFSAVDFALNKKDDNILSTSQLFKENLPFEMKSSEKSLNNSKNSVKKLSKKTKRYIAEIYLEGTIEEENSTYNQQWLLNLISSLKDDEKNEAIALYINSPGGTVYQADEIYLALQNYKTSGKQIYVYQESMAASGGYYISCAANKIYANRNTLTGSIGVISGTSFDLTGLFNNLGIKSETIHAGKNKNMGNYNEPLSDEQREILQSIADECYEQFTSIVSTQRNIPIDKVKKLSDGRIYTAKQALDENLIDKIDSPSNMIEDLKESLNTNENVSSEISTVTFKYEKKKSFMESMLSSISSIKESEAAAKLGIPQKVLKDINKSISYPAFIYTN